MTFREQIEEIEDTRYCQKVRCPNLDDVRTEYNLCPCVKCRTDRICEAVAGLAEEMGNPGSEVPDEYEGHGGEVWAYLDGASDKKIQCLAFIRKECGK